MSRFKPHSLNWLGAGAQIRLGQGAIEITDPLAYFCEGETRGSEEEPAAIDLTLPVAAFATPPSERELSFWPRYAQLSANQRRLYLDWLSSGRVTSAPEAGYLFLYFYGLERRALLERQEVKRVFREVFRLRALHRNANAKINTSFDRYSLHFLWYLLLRDADILNAKYFDALSEASLPWSVERLQFATAHLYARKSPVPGCIAFALAGTLGGSRQSVVVQRVGEELRVLFLKRYTERFGAGLIPQQKRDQSFSYKPASKALQTTNVMAPSPMAELAQFEELSELWNQCIGELKRLSTVVAGTAKGVITIEAWNAMPAELRARVDHPQINAFNTFISENTSANGLTIARGRDVAALTGIAADAKLTTAACRLIAKTAADVGYCIEPDPRLTGRAFRDDEQVVIFLNLWDTEANAGRYTTASTLLNVGLALAAVDGHVDEREMAVLIDHLESVLDLNEFERRRLDMLRGLRQMNGLSITEAIRPLKSLASGDREKVVKLAIALVCADGVVTPQERNAIRRLYGALGLNRDLAAADLAQQRGAPGHPVDEPVVVAPAVSGGVGEAIPQLQEPESRLPLRFNREAIDAILKDTSEVARMLADAMNVDSGADVLPVEQPVPVMTVPPDATPLNAALPLQYQGFFGAVVHQHTWMRDELARIAREHGVMLAGAVDAINDWSTERNGGPLLYDEGSRFTLETEYLT